jgi:hypothetical protein
MLLAAALTGDDAQASGIGRHHLAQGPFGLPSLRVLEEKLDLSHDQRERIMILYNESKHKSHGRHHLTPASGTEGKQESLRNELVSKIEALLNSTQRPIFAELIKHHGRKLKGT